MQVFLLRVGGTTTLGRVSFSGERMVTERLVYLSLELNVPLLPLFLLELARDWSPKVLLLGLALATYAEMGRARGN